MFWKTVTEWTRRFDAVLAGYNECRGIFRITDDNGVPLDGVEVQFRIGDAEWTPCGRSCECMRKATNFNQPSTVYYPIGEPVAWRFFKPGYIEAIVTRYTANTVFNETMDTIMLRRNGLDQRE